MAVNCEFHDANNEIKSAIIQNCRSKHLRRLALREDALILDSLLAKAHGLEVSELQTTEMEEKLPSGNKQSDGGINAVKGNR